MAPSRNESEKRLYEEAQKKCAEEKIHIPGSVQPYSYLLVLDQTLKVLKCSENVSDILGSAVESILSSNASEFFEEDTIEDLKTRIKTNKFDEDAFFTVAVKNDVAVRDFHAFLYTANDLILLEIEAQEEHAKEKLYESESTFTKNLLQKNTLQAQQQYLVDSIKNISEHGRIFLYIFDGNWNGQVVAESIDASSKSYLGLNFPASDLPKQARNLYYEKATRYIPIVDYAPQKIVPDDLDDSGKKIDLTLLNGRSISPIHRDYMKNMGIAGSISFALFKDNKLYGLVICHSDQANYMPPRTRLLAKNFTSIYSALLSTADLQAVQEDKDSRQACMAELAQAIRNPVEKSNAIEEIYIRLLNFMGACGVALSVGGEQERFGQTPAESRIDDIVKALQAETTSTVYESNFIENDLRLEQDDTDEICGLLAFPVPQKQQPDYIIWFRKEDIVEKNWAGDPIKNIEKEDGAPKILPRADFAIWKQTYDRHSKAWTDNEKNLAMDVAHIALAVTQLILAQHQNQILLQAIEACKIGITLADASKPDLPLSYINQTFLDYTGYEKNEVLGRNCRFLQGEGTNPDIVKDIRIAIEERRSIDVDILNYKKDGTPFWNNLHMTPVLADDKALTAYAALQTHVTQARERLRLDSDRQKLEALGRLTGNISHELKNALQPVLLIAGTLKDWKSLGDDSMERCVEILNDNIMIANGVVRDVLSFSRQSSDEIEKIAIIELQDSVVNFVRNLLNARVEYIIEPYGEYDKEGYFANLKYNQLYQILINLINNALYVMEDQGTLTLHWGVKALNAEESEALGVSANTYLCIGIQDTGSGMDEKTINSAFDPFYSTKPPGEGTGLGLSISYRIVKEWGGTIDVESKIGEGSTFTIYLPLVE